MLRRLVISIYWGPSWLNKALSCFLQGGWPHKPSKKKKTYRAPFQRRFNYYKFPKNLKNDLRKFWPKGPKFSVKFLKDEWEKHGRGSTMSPVEYFSTVMDIYQAIMKLGIELEVGVPLHADYTLSRFEAILGKVHMVALQRKGEIEGDDKCYYISELKIEIDRRTYGIVSRSKKAAYLGGISRGDEPVILPRERVELQYDDGQVV